MIKRGDPENRKSMISVSDRTSFFMSEQDRAQGAKSQNANASLERAGSFRRRTKVHQSYMLV